MLNLRDLIFSQSQSQSQQLSELEPILQPLPISDTLSSAAAIDDSENPVYDDDEYVDDYPYEIEIKARTYSKKRKGSRYGDEVPLLRTNPRPFSKIYAASPELNFFKRKRFLKVRSRSSNEV